MGLVGYIFYKVGGLFFRAGAASQQYRNHQQSRREGSINGRATSHKSKRSGTIKGGDYVDYEEVK